MDVISGVSNWQLTIRREADSITVLRALTGDAKATLPESLFGLPVTALGSHALCPTSSAEQGEQVQITCGAPAENPDNSHLRDLTLPATLRRVGDYAFLNCRELKTLRLWDDIALWGGGALMNCRSLSEIHLTWNGKQGETLPFFADELSRELDVTLYTPEGKARLIFPEYVEIYEENCQAQHFDYNIQGAGYPYHHCFRWKRLSFWAYDDLWPGYLGRDHEDGTAVRLAWWRLRYPLELSERAAEAYRSYLLDKKALLLDWLVRERDASGLSSMLKWVKPTAEQLSAACTQAREAGSAELLAILLEAQHRDRPARKKTFDL